MKILISSRNEPMMFHWNEFGKHLEKLDNIVMVVNNRDILDGFPSKKISKWFETKRKFNALIKDFKPDIILLDSVQRQFGIAAINVGVPVVMHLPGDLWEEIDIAKRTSYTSFLRKIMINKIEKMSLDTLEKVDAILPISSYLDNIVKRHLPDKQTHVMGNIINPDIYVKEKGVKLKHPCVGLVQKANIWTKCKEMLILEDALKKLPDVTFYWAGYGHHQDKILEKLTKYDNFIFLANLSYPDKIRQFLTEIDIYALISGMDAWSFSTREALLVGNPVITSNVGGLPELIKNKKSGMLVDINKPDQIVDAVRYILKNPDKANTMAEYGRKLTIDGIDGNIIAGDFHEFCKEIIFNYFNKD